jgi:hypothetical protein
MLVTLGPTKEFQKETAHEYLKWSKENKFKAEYSSLTNKCNFILKNHIKFTLKYI